MTKRELAFGTKRWLAQDAVSRLRRKCKDQHEGQTQCHVCGEWCESQDSQTVDVEGDRVEFSQMGETLCENCYDNLKCEIDDMLNELDRPDYSDIDFSGWNL